MLGKDDERLAGDKARLAALSELSYSSCPWLLGQARKESPLAGNNSHLDWSFLQTIAYDPNDLPTELSCRQQSSRLLALGEIQTLARWGC
jgi:hypothetical protein